MICSLAKLLLLLIRALLVMKSNTHGVHGELRISLNAYLWHPLTTSVLPRFFVTGTSHGACASPESSKRAWPEICPCQRESPSLWPLVEWQVGWSPKWAHRWGFEPCHWRERSNLCHGRCSRHRWSSEVSRPVVQKWRVEWAEPTSARSCIESGRRASQKCPPRVCGFLTFLGFVWHFTFSKGALQFSDVFSRSSDKVVECCR